MSATFIYALCEPGTQTVRYIGQTINLLRREHQHFSESPKKKTHLGCWLKSLRSRGVRAELIVLAQVSWDARDEMEKECIRRALEHGMDLVNATEGGRGITMTPEIRAKISRSLTGKPKSKEHVEKQSGERSHLFGKLGSLNPFFGRKHSEAHKLEMRARAIVRLYSVETRAKMSASQKLRFAREKS